MSSYWQNEIDPWARASQNIGQMLLQTIPMRAAAADRQSQAQLRKAQMETEEAQARKYNAEADGMDEDQKAVGEFSMHLENVIKNPNDPDAIAKAISGYGKFFKKNPEAAANGLGTLLSQFQAFGGSTNYPQIASLQGNADRVYDTDVRAKTLAESMALRKNMVPKAAMPKIAPEATVFKPTAVDTAISRELVKQVLEKHGLPYVQQKGQPDDNPNGKPNVMGGFMRDGVPLTVPPDEEMNLIREYQRLRQSGMSPAEAEQTVKMGTFVAPVTTRIPGTPAKMGLFSMKPGTPATLQTNAFNVKTAFTPPATPAPEDIGEFPVAVPGQARREGYYKTPSGVRYWDGSAWIVE